MRVLCFTYIHSDTRMHSEITTTHNQEDFKHSEENDHCIYLHCLHAAQHWSNSKIASLKREREKKMTVLIIHTHRVGTPNQ